MNTDPDLPGLLAATREAGADAVVVAWDDPGVDWTVFDLVVIRSVWDYSWRVAEFLAWVGRCAAVTRVANEPDTIQWNVHKTYLAELADQGLPVVATRYVHPGERVVLPDDGEFVVKPVVGAGSRHAARYRPAERAVAEEHVRLLHASGTAVMVQPYVHAIDTAGERALVFLGGVFVHAIRKRAVLVSGLGFQDRREGHPGVEPYRPTDAELVVARRALQAVPGGQPLYARVDLVSDDGTGVLLNELELIEPRLYLESYPGSEAVAARAFVAAAHRAHPAGMV